MGLAPRSRASLNLVRVLTDRSLSCLPGEGERARPAGWRARHGAPESRSGLLARAGRGRREAVLAKGRSGHGGGHRGHGAWPWFGSGCRGQGYNRGAGNRGYSTGRSGGLWSVLWGRDGALALWATPWREYGRRNRTRGRTWIISEQNSHLSHIILPYKTDFTNVDVSYLTSCWGRRCRPQGGGVGAGAGGTAGGSGRADESYPGALKGWHYPGSFHLRLQEVHWTHYCLHLELPCWAHMTRCSPPRGSSDTLLVRSELR